jgi:hypothetical protein
LYQRGNKVLCAPYDLQLEKSAGMVGNVGNRLYYRNVTYPKFAWLAKRKIASHGNRQK